METKTGGRLASLDALRGFDMFFIMGGQGLIYAIATALGHPDFKDSFGHVPWDGLHFVDTIFPLFLFIAGVTFPFSAAKRIEGGATRSRLVWHSIRRGLTIMLLGYICNGLLNFNFAKLRVYGVLQHIGFCWMVAALLFLAFRRNTRIVIAAALLVGSWLFFRFVVTHLVINEHREAFQWCLIYDLADLGNLPAKPVVYSPMSRPLSAI